VTSGMQQAKQPVSALLTGPWRRGGYAHGGAVRPRMLALSAISTAGIGLDGYLGGKHPLRRGVRIAGEQTRAGGFVETAGEAAVNHRAPYPG
jgi:hypothetical protein